MSSTRGSRAGSGATASARSLPPWTAGVDGVPSSALEGLSRRVITEWPTGDFSFRVSADGFRPCCRGDGGWLFPYWLTCDGGPLGAASRGVCRGGQTPHTGAPPLTHRAQQIMIEFLDCFDEPPLTSDHGAIQRRIPSIFSRQVGVPSGDAKLGLTRFPAVGIYSWHKDPTVFAVSRLETSCL